MESIRIALSMLSTKAIENEYLSTVSYRIRSSLTSITGFASLLINEKLCSITAEQKEFLGNVLTSANEMSEYLAHELEKHEQVSVELLARVSFKLRTMLDSKLYNTLTGCL